MGGEDKETTTREVELQRLMPHDQAEGDSDWHSSDQDDESFDNLAYPEARPSRPVPFWRRILYNFPRSSSRRHENYSEAANLSGGLPKRRSCTRKTILLSILGVIFLGAAGLIFVEFAGIHGVTYRPPWSTPHWLNSSFSYPQDFTQMIKPLPCISHNDESRSVPLFEAISNGCTGVEADIYLRNGNQVLVGHRQFWLTAERTVSNMYISPLAQIVSRIEGKPANEVGVFDRDPKKSLVMMFDFKERGTADDLYRALEVELKPLRELKALSHVEDGAFVASAITIVVSGDAPFQMIKQSTTNDIFFDSPLRWIWKDHSSSLDADAESSPEARAGSGQGYGGTEELKNAHEFDDTNSYFASMSFAHSYWPPLFGLSKIQKKEMKEQVEAAHAHGLKVRYWGTYDWPWTKIRERLWRFFGEAKVDIWNVDDLAWYSKDLWRKEKRG